MKKPSWQRHKNLLTGFFVACALITFLISTVLLFQRKGIFNPRYVLNAVFDNGVGMRQGADVLFNGVKVGRVESVSLAGPGAGSGSAGKVVLGLSIDRKYQEFITQNSAAYALRDKNLVSDRVVNIETSAPGGSMLHSGDTLAVSEARDIETVMTGLSKLMGKMDQLINSVDGMVAMGASPGSSVGAMLNSRELYDRMLSGASQVDAAAGEGRQALAGIRVMSDTIHASLGTLLARADTTSARFTRASGEVEKLGARANVLADRGEAALVHADEFMLQGADKMQQAGNVMSAVSKLWFLRGKLEPKPALKLEPMEEIKPDPDERKADAGGLAKPEAGGIVKVDRKNQTFERTP